MHAVPWPPEPSVCLSHLLRSFDMIKDDLGAPRSTFPHTVYMVAGTQAETAKQNYVAFLRLEKLGQVRVLSLLFRASTIR